MKEDNLIDTPEIEPKRSSIMNLILWWEKKRIYYNLALLSIMAFDIYDHWSKVEMVGFDTIAFYAIYLLFGANLYYTLGWAVGLPLHLIFKNDEWSYIGRWILFILGSIFSVLWMLIIFSDAIRFGLVI